MTTEHFDVVIIGAGLSGIAAAHHIAAGCPERRFVVLESRNAIGGTWNLFRYPGIRSDSDMPTLGYGFRPWLGAKAIAAGPDILDYINATACESKLAAHIRLGHRVIAADWSSTDARWTLTIDHEGQRLHISCGFLFSCSGYYRYDRGYLPEFAGIEQFAGQCIHPQFWPEALETRDKRIIVIGSGATAITLVPALASTASHVTMVQRSPTYVVSQPTEDNFGQRLRRWLPQRPAHHLTRARNILASMLAYQLARRWPRQVRDHILADLDAEIGDIVDIKRHFTPRYLPWDQRICVVADGDLFACLRAGSASIETGTIAHFEPAGLRLNDGRLVEADIIVTATGLELEFLGGMQITIDGATVDLSARFAYKGMMYSGVPNLASAIGYTNASWTLKCELIAQYVVRLLNHMALYGYKRCEPVPKRPIVEAPLFPLSAGYIERAKGRFPRQGVAPPWRTHQNYVLDLIAFRFGKIDDGIMRFGGAGQVSRDR